MTTGSVISITNVYVFFATYVPGFYADHKRNTQKTLALLLKFPSSDDFGEIARSSNRISVQHYSAPKYCVLMCFTHHKPS